MHKYWDTFWAFRKLWFMRVLEYRGNFFFWAFIDVMWTCFTLIFFSLIINVSGNIGGWSRSEMLLLLGVFSILEALMWSICYHNMWHFTDSIYSGEFNLLLLKPLDTQFLLMTSRNSYSNISRIIIGIIMVGVACQQMSLTPTLIDLLVATVLLLLGFLFLYFFWFSLAILGFYLERVRNINEIIPALDAMWRVPNSVHSGATFLIFTSIIPLALLTTLPSEAIMGIVNWQFSITLLVATIATFIFSRWFFKYSVKNYSGSAQ